MIGASTARPRPTAPLALVVALLVGATLATASPVRADQDEPRLDVLFDALAEADDPADARRLESEIWLLWLRAPDEDSQRLMSAVQGAMADGDAERALGLADRLVELAPDYAEGWNKRATILYVMGEHDASVADIRETLAREPRHFGAISGLGQIFLKRGEPGAALEAFEQALALSPASAQARAAVAFARAALEKKKI